MKKLLILLMLLPALAIAQGGPGGQGGGRDKREEMLESLRVAFISRQLELTPEEAQKFWPVYNSYQGDLRKIMQEQREKKGSELDLEERVLNLRKRYKPEFTKTVSEEKFDRLMKAERTWGEMLRKEIQRRREAGERPPGMMRPMPPGGPGGQKNGS